MKVGVKTNLRLAWNRGNIAHFLSFQGVDDGRFADIGVPNEPNAYLLFIRVELDLESILGKAGAKASARVMMDD